MWINGYVVVVIRWCLPNLIFAAEPINLLLIISDDFTATALSCYENQVCRTPQMDSLISCVTGKNPAVCDRLVELLDLCPMNARRCGLTVPPHLQSPDISAMLDRLPRKFATLSS